jgi:hypothetical protein
MNTDCTLAKFEGIFWLSRNLEASTGLVCFQPSYPCRSSSRLRAKCKVSNYSYASICLILGVSSNAEIAANVKRTMLSCTVRRSSWCDSLSHWGAVETE